VADPADDTFLDAGRPAPWRTAMEAALDGADAHVPCAGCTACCRASQFIPVHPDEADALAALPAELLFPMPGRPDVRLLGYTEEGHCPMLVDDRCTVYEHRPRACRAYDCRVFTATGVAPDAELQPAVAARVGRWRFDVVDADDRAVLAALQAAGRWVEQHGATLAPAVAPVTAVQRALLALELHGAFLDGPDRPSVEALVAALEVRLGAR
jgi:hypothetical protein